MVVDSLSVTNGSVSDDGLGNYTFTPDDNFCGTARIQLPDQGWPGRFDLRTLVELTIDSVNDAPDATYVTPQTTGEGSARFISGQLTSYDPDTVSESGDTASICSSGCDLLMMLLLLLVDDPSKFLKEVFGRLIPMIQSYDLLRLLDDEQVITIEYSVTDSDGASSTNTFDYYFWFQR